LVDVDPDAGESVLVERITALERLKAAAAGQARLAAALDAARRSAEAAAGVPAARRGKGVATEVALARRDSPARARYHSVAPPAPGTPRDQPTQIEVYLNGELLKVIAA
jgi:hypothetical protein